MSIAESMSWLKEYLDCVNLQLAELFPPHSSTALENAVADALSGGAKRVRAILALLWCEVFCGDYRPAIPLAVAYELAHASALVQDDIIDRSDTRRGRKSIVANYGLTNAVLASDLLLFHVPKMVAKYHDLESARLARLFDLVGEACRGTTWGEFLDLEMARREKVSEGEYEEMIRLKTATLLSAPSASGAIVGGAPDGQVSLASRFGEWLGMSYQVQDDVLDLIGDGETLGKPVFTDLRGGKKSLVLIHCLKRCSREEREFISSLFNREGSYCGQEISRTRKVLERCGSVEYAQERALHYLRQAKEILSAIPECRARSLLLELSDYLAARHY